MDYDISYQAKKIQGEKLQDKKVVVNASKSE